MLLLDNQRSKGELDVGDTDEKRPTKSHTRNQVLSRLLKGLSQTFLLFDMPANAHERPKDSTQRRPETTGRSGVAFQAHVPPKASSPCLLLLQVKEGPR